MPPGNRQPRLPGIAREFRAGLSYPPIDPVLSDPAPTLAAIRSARQTLGDLIRVTPVWQWRSRRFSEGTEVYLKLELLQYTGSFKPRGALTRMFALTPEQLARGVTAVSAGNHAAAVGYAAAVFNTTAKVVMPQTSDPARVALCRSFGAEVVLVENVHAAFAAAVKIEAEEKRTFIHPFEGPEIALGTATLGLELDEQCPALDAVIVPIGGGGLCGGVAAAMKQRHPQCRIIGVEPFGADTMFRSFASGQPESIAKVNTIADSLGAPHAAPYSFALCRRFVDELVRVDDEALCAALYVLFHEMKLAVEPAGAAATAALLGPLRARLAGKKVGLIVCGANLAASAFAEYLRRGEAASGQYAA